MTQQPYGYPAPQQPQQYAQPINQPGQYAPQAPQQTYAPQYPQQPGYLAQPQQQYAPAPQAPAGPPPVPLADGSIDAFYSQPNTGGGPGVSWKGKPDGYTVQGLIPRDVTNADVTQEVGAPNTNEAGRPQFYRDGRPKFVMAVPLQVQASQEYPEGEARLFVRGQLRDELGRAMAEANVEGAPKAGAVLTVTLVQRKQGRGSIPQNVFAVVYTPAGGSQPAPQQPQAPAPQQEQHYAPQPQQPVQQQYAQPQYVPQQPQGQAPQGTGAPSPAPVPQQAPQNPATQSQQPQPPSDMSPQQQELMARLTGGQG